MADQQLVDTLWKALASVNDPEIRRPITELGMVEGVDIDEAGHVTVKLLLTIAGCPLKDQLRTDVTTAVARVPEVTSVEVEMGTMNDEQRLELRRKLGGQVREIPFNRPDSLTRVIAVASGKGGVGKSSVTVNLALALAARDKRVGILDADIYGHSVPGLLGIEDARPTGVDGMVMPVPAFGLSVISMGMFKENSGDVVAWRGPILDKALTQLLTDVVWGDLDFLFLDLPPGTGDIAMSLGAKLPNAEYLVVTTPQAAAAEVAERAGTMASLMEQKVLGVIENMSYFSAPCPHCGEPIQHDIFGSGGGQAVAQAISSRAGYRVEVLIQIPLEPALRQGGDEGSPIVLAEPDSPAAQAFATLAEKLDVKRSLVGRLLGIQPAAPLN